MSDWIQDNAANRIKKSYFNGFIDMSGGELTVRHRGATFGGDVSFGSGVDISGDISTRGDVDLGGTLTVTEDLSAHALVAAQQLTVAGNSSFAGVNIGGDLNVGGSITSGGGTLELEGLTLTGDLSAHALISTENLNVVSDASFGNDVYINGNLDVAGDVSAGAGAFTGDAAAYRSITGVTGVYMGAYGNNALMNIVSEGDGADIRFQSNATGVTTTGNIIYHNESETEADKKSSFRIAPHYANQDMGLQIQSFADPGAEVSIQEGMLTIKRGLESTVRNYETKWKKTPTSENANLEMNQYPFSSAPHVTNAYFHIDGADGHDLLLTGHGYTAPNDETRGFNLYSKHATYAENSESHDSQGLCIQTSYNDGTSTSYDFRLGIGDRPKAYQFLTTKDAKIGGKLDVDGSLNVNSDASFGGDLIVHGAGMFTGSTNINSRTTPSGVYIGNNGSAGSQDSIIQMTSDGDQSVIDFTSSAATGNETDYEGRIIYNNSTNPNPYRLYLIPKYSSPFVGLKLDSISSNLIQATVDGDLRSTRNLDVNGAAVMDGNLTVGNTLTITETGTGTAAGHSSGSILLKRSSNNGRSSIVFDSVNSGDDFAYIEFQDNGGPGNGSANGQLTIGVQNDTSDAAKERIRFDIAGAYAYLQMHDNGAGGNLGSIFSADATSCKGIYPESYNLNTEWNTTLDYYNTVNETNRYTMYQYFNHTESYIHDMALVGYNAGSGSGVNPDGNLSYGYMYRSRGAPNKFISFQTRGLRYSDNDTVNGMRLGVNAVPGYTYDFAVGGKSYFGNDVTVTGDLTVGGAGIFTGVSTDYNHTTSPAGIYIGKYVSEPNEYAYMQIVSNNSVKKSWIDFTNTGTVDPAGDDNYQDYEGRIAYYGAGGTTTDPSKSFIIHPYGNNGGTLKLQSLASSAAEATVDGMLTLQGGVGSDIRNYETIWGNDLSCGNSYNTTNPTRYAAYLYVDHGWNQDSDLLLTGHESGGDYDTIGYNLYSRGAVEDGATDQGLCIQTYYSNAQDSTQCFRIGLGNRPGAYQFLTTGHVQVGGNLDVYGNLTVAGTNTYTSLQASTLGSMGDLTISPTGKVHITKSLQVDGSVNFTGDIIKTDTIVRMTEQVDISNDGTGPALKVTQHGVHDVAEFYDDNDLVMIVKNGGDVSFAQSVTVGGDLTVDGTLTTTSTVNTNTYTAGQINDNSFSIYSNANGTIQYRADYSDASAGIYMRLGRNSVETQELIPSMNFVKDGLGDEPIKIAYYAVNKEICNLNTYWHNDSSAASFAIDVYNQDRDATSDPMERIVEFTNTRGVRTANFSSNLVFTENHHTYAPMLTNDLSGLLVVTYPPANSTNLIGPQNVGVAHDTRPTEPGVHMGVWRWQRQDNGNWEQQYSAEIDLFSSGDAYNGNFITFWMSRYGSATDGKYIARMFSRIDANNDKRFHLQTYGHDWAIFENNNLNVKSVIFNADVYATSYSSTSDLRLKTDIETIENALDKVCRLRGVSYRFKENYDAGSTKSLGMIAQEMEQEFPELVCEFKKDTDGDGEAESYKAISYGGFTAPLLEAIKELKVRNDALEAKTPELETKLGSLETTVAAMNARIKALETA